MVVVERRNVEQRGQDFVGQVRDVRDVGMVEVDLVVQICGAVVLVRRQMGRYQVVRQLLLQMDGQVVLLLERRMLLLMGRHRRKLLLVGLLLLLLLLRRRRLLLLLLLLRMLPNEGRSVLLLRMLRVTTTRVMIGVTGA